MATSAERAQGLIGAPFRLHGRDPASGLDCIGLAALAFELRDVATGYSVRTTAEAVARGLAGHGFRRVAAAAPGDLLLLQPGPAQGHLAIRTAGGFVHADAGLGRVVETPGAPAWPIVAAYRKD